MLLLLLQLLFLAGSSSCLALVIYRDSSVVSPPHNTYNLLYTHHTERLLIHMEEETTKLSIDTVWLEIEHQRGGLPPTRHTCRNDP